MKRSEDGNAGSGSSPMKTRPSDSLEPFYRSSRNNGVLGRSISTRLIWGVEETGTSQNALFPFGRRLMQHDHFLGGKITATFRLDLMSFVSTKSKKFQNTYHQNSILLQKKREFYPRLIKQFCRRILTVLFLHPS